MKAVKNKIQCQKHTFELFGYDFIFDEDFNTILIEVNTNPCLEESSKLLKCLIPRMLDDMLALTMDPLFNQSEDKYNSTYSLPGDLFMIDQKENQAGDRHPGYRNDENLFKLVHTVEF
jgi:hypothetical protein